MSVMNKSDDDDFLIYSTSSLTSSSSNLSRSKSFFHTTPLPLLPLAKKAFDQDIATFDPKTILTVLDSYPPRDEEEYWKYFKMAYPDAESYITSLRFALDEFKRLTTTRRHWQEFKPVSLLYISRKELGDDLIERLTRLDPEPFRWRTYCSALEFQIRDIRDSWNKLHDKISSIPDMRAIQVFELRTRIDDVLHQLDEDLLQVDNKMKDSYNKYREEMRRASLGARERLSEFICRQRDKSRSELWKDILGQIGSYKVMLGGILVCVLASASTTAVATWKCTPPETTPTVDSNFWSTLSSCIVALAGLYCILLPRLRGSKLEVGNETLFYALLATSMLTALASIPSYLYQTRLSLVLLFVSSATQLAVTLQVILGADSEIQQQGERIMDLNSEVEFWRGRG